MLTQRDIDEVEKLIDRKFDEKLKIVPSKDLFLKKMDQLVGEIKAAREEQTALSS